MMKHRSTVIFVIVVAALAVAPQAAQQLDEFAGNVSARMEGAVWNAFLSLPAQGQKQAATLRGTNMADANMRAAVTSCPMQQPSGVSRNRKLSAASAQRTASATARTGVNPERAFDTKLGFIARHSAEDFSFSFDGQTPPVAGLFEAAQTAPPVVYAGQPQDSARQAREAERSAVAAKTEMGKTSKAAEQVRFRLLTDKKQLARTLAQLEQAEVSKAAERDVWRLIEYGQRQAGRGDARRRSLNDAAPEPRGERNGGERGAPPVLKVVRMRAQANVACPVQALEGLPRTPVVAPTAPELPGVNAGF